MVRVSIRELTHNFSKYLKTVKAGEHLLILERNRPVAEMIAHNENLNRPGWKRDLEKLSLKGKPMSQLIAHERKEEKG